MTSNERAVAIAGTVNSDNIFTKITTVKIIRKGNNLFLFIKGGSNFLRFLQLYLM